MKDIFAEFYNKVIGFFRRTEEAEESSKDVARNRLRVVLMQDRTNLTPKILEQMRGELIELLSRYVEMDKELLELNFEQEGDQVALMLSIPVIRAKDEEEIEEALKQREQESQESTDVEICDENSETCDENAGDVPEDGEHSAPVSTPDEMNNQNPQQQEEETQEQPIG